MIDINTRDLDQQQQNLDRVRAEMDYLKQEFDKNMTKLQTRAADFERKITEYTNMHNIARTVLSDLPVSGTVSVYYIEAQDALTCMFVGNLDRIINLTGASRNEEGFYCTKINGYNVQFTHSRQAEVLCAYIDGIGGLDSLSNSATSTTEQDDFIPDDDM